MSCRNSHYPRIKLKTKRINNIPLEFLCGTQKLTFVSYCLAIFSHWLN
jgi:hypothetical protein